MWICFYFFNTLLHLIQKLAKDLWNQEWIRNRCFCSRKKQMFCSCSQINAITKSGSHTQCKVQQFVVATPNSDSCISNLYYKNRTCSVFKRDQRRVRSWSCRELPDSGTKCQQQAQLTEITMSNCIKDAPACISPK